MYSNGTRSQRIKLNEKGYLNIKNIKRVFFGKFSIIAYTKDGFILKDYNSKEHFTFVWHLNDDKLSFSIHKTLENTREHEHLINIVFNLSSEIKELVAEEMSKCLRPISLEKIDNCYIIRDLPKDLIFKYCTYKRRRELIVDIYNLSKTEQLILKPKDFIQLSSIVKGYLFCNDNKYIGIIMNFNGHLFRLDEDCFVINVFRKLLEKGLIKLDKHKEIADIIFEIGRKRF